jgi:putative NADH-flavin reductase
MTAVVLFGATGSIGRTIAAELVRRGHQVTGVSRSGTSAGAGVTPAAGDASSAADVARLAAGAEAVISATGPRRDGSDPADGQAGVARALVDGLRAAGVGRLIVVGGAGSLRQDGGRHVDNPHFPDAWKPLALGAASARDFYRTVSDVDWLYVSPAAVIEPGERTGTFRVGRDELLTDASGASRISTEDYAIGIADQLERPTAHHAQITLAY